MTEDKTQKFLFGPREFKKMFSQLGTRIKYAKGSITEKKMYAELKHHIRDYNTAKKHANRQKFYDLKFDEKYTAYKEEGLTEKQASKRARQFAISKTAMEFDVTESGIKKSLFPPTKATSKS